MEYLCLVFSQYNSQNNFEKTQVRSYHSSRTHQGQTISFSVKSEILIMAYKALSDLPQPLSSQSYLPLLTPAY